MSSATYSPSLFPKKPYGADNLPPQPYFCGREPVYALRPYVPQQSLKGAEHMEKHRGRSRFIALCVAPCGDPVLYFYDSSHSERIPHVLFERGAYSPTETFVGLKNFQMLFRDSQFIRSMQNTILLIVVVTVITFARAGVCRHPDPGEDQRAKFLPRGLLHPQHPSVVVISGIFSAIYKPENGMLNSILSMLSGKTVMVLWKDEPLVMVSIIIAMVWQAVGYYMVMYMASMSSVPQSLYESAGLDGPGG